MGPAPYPRNKKMEKNSETIADSEGFSALNESYYSLSNQYQLLSDNYRKLSEAYRKELAVMERNYKKLKKSNSKLLLREFIYKKTFEDHKEELGQLKGNEGDGKVSSFFTGLIIGAIGSICFFSLLSW